MAASCSPLAAFHISWRQPQQQQQHSIRCAIGAPARCLHSQFLKGAACVSWQAHNLRALGRRPCRRSVRVSASLLGVGAPEVIVIAVVALLVFGPKGLAEVARSLGQSLRAFQPTIRELQSVSRDFKQTLEKEIGLDELKQQQQAQPESAPKPTVNESSVIDELTVQLQLLQTAKQSASAAVKEATAGVEAAPAAAVEVEATVDAAAESGEAAETIEDAAAVNNVGSSAAKD